MKAIQMLDSFRWVCWMGFVLLAGVGCGNSPGQNHPPADGSDADEMAGADETDAGADSGDDAGMDASVDAGADEVADAEMDTGPDACEPRCANRECGDDGCGGQCGVCQKPLFCGGAGVEGKCGVGDEALPVACPEGCVQSLRAFAQKDGLRLEWSPVTDALSYRIYLATVPITAQNISTIQDLATQDTSSLFVELGGLQPFTEYFAVVGALGPAGESEPSPWVSARTLPAQTAAVADLLPDPLNTDLRGARAICLAGDVNQDGLLDVVTGDDTYLQNVGKAYAWHGVLGAIGGEPNWTVEGQPCIWGTKRFGREVAGAGDVNGDGYSDVIVAWRDTKVRLYLGGPTGLATGHSAEFDRGSDSNQAVPIGGAGDVNGDGFDDVIVGAPFWVGADGFAHGRVRIYHGNAAGLELAPSYNLEWEDEASQDAQLGMTLAGVGDVNGDGFDDVLIGAPGWVGGAGKVMMYLGGASDLSLEPAWSQEGLDAFERLGYQLAAAGDVNHDGYPDVLVGLGANQANAASRVLLFLGNANGLDNASAMEVSSSEPMLVPLGGFDINQDGISDFAVFDGQRIRIYLGSASALSLTPFWSQRLDAGQTIASLERAVAGDISGDGKTDLLILGKDPNGAPWTGVFYGKDQARAVSVDTSGGFLAETSADRDLSQVMMATGNLAASPIYSCKVRWGDQKPPSTLSACDLVSLQALAHRYSQAGRFTILISAQTDNGELGSAAATVVVSE